MLQMSRIKITSIEAWEGRFSTFKPNFKSSPRPCLLIPQDQFPEVLYKYEVTLCAESNIFHCPKNIQTPFFFQIVKIHMVTAFSFLSIAFLSISSFHGFASGNKKM